MTDLEKYEAVNKCETYEEFDKVLLSFADENGEIEGRNRKFNVTTMREGAYAYFYNKMWGSPNTVTRMWGLRQQLMYLKYYKTIIAYE